MCGKKLCQPPISNDSHWFEKKYEIYQIKRMEDENSSLDKKCNFISFRRREAGNPIIVQIKYSNIIFLKLEYHRMNKME